MKKVGEYSVTSIDFNTWFTEDQNVKVVPKNKKQKTKKKILYPIFMEFSAISTDIFWTKKFNLWATGKLPKFFSINENVLTYNKNSAVECIFDQDVNTNMKACIKFFKIYGGLFSKKDENDVDEDEETSSDPTSELTEPEPKTWSQFDKKSQELMLKNYTNDLTEVMSLTTKESSLLLQTLRLAVSAKNFNKNNITIDQGKITDIKGLLYDSSNKLFKIDYTISNAKVIIKKKDLEDSEESSDSDTYVSELTKDMIPQFGQKINKYYELYDKKYKKYQR